MDKSLFAKIITLPLALLSLLFANSHASDNPATDEPASDYAATYVVTDVHGDYHTLIKLLRHAKIIDHNNQWIAKSSQLISLGDNLDRGPDSRKVLDLWIDLEQQAKKAGGQFLMVLGNHEVMNIRGDLRYVALEEFAAFQDMEDTSYRQQIYQDFLIDTKQQDNPESKKAFLELYPPGFFGLVQAYSPSGYYGQWLVNKPVALHFQERLFAHGGYSQQLLDLELGLDELNQQFQQDIINYANLYRELTDAGLFKHYHSKRDRHKIAQALINDEDLTNQLDSQTVKKKAADFVKASNSLVFNRFGPTWYRGNVYCHQYAEQQVIDNTLKRFNAKQILVGHTPDSSRLVRSRFNDTFIMLDTGMLQSHYQGNPSLVRIVNEQLSVINLHDPENQQPTSDPIRQPPYPNELSDGYLEDFFNHAMVLEQEQLERKLIGKGSAQATTLTFKLDEQIHSANFFFTNSESNANQSINYHHELAAYKLDRLLGLQMVPFTMPYSIGTVNGILQYKVEDALSKAELSKKQLQPSGFCSHEAEQALMQLFDQLIHNTERDLSNQLLSTKDGLLWLTSHSKAFRADKQLLESSKTPPQYLADDFKNKLLALNKSSLEQQIGDILSAQQIEALLIRRDKILARFN
ncbi:MAG: metallophosphoesterase [Kangiellaceae bacterium]|nr:metallophosphoesterase [Kangiellaceae bacterium]